MYAKNGFRVGFGHVGVQKTVVLVAKNGFEKMKFFGRRSVLTRFTNVANSENAFSCGFLRMERFNLALPVRQSWECGIPKMRDPSDLAQTLSWLPHGCSAGMDGVCGNVIMVATWMLCGNG